VDLLCPFLDSRMLRLALNLPSEVRYRFRKPKDLLKRALARRDPTGARRELATRCKLGFGQPIFEWLSPGGRGEGAVPSHTHTGQLRPLIDRLSKHDFVDPVTLERARRQPTWFLSTLLCYDTWHRLFIERSLRSSQLPALSRQPAEESSPTRTSCGSTRAS
jgi:hypothetical protein